MSEYTANPQPAPQSGKQEVLPEVLKDLQTRAIRGVERYGHLLETHNGRDALLDAYEEALDMAMYLKQAIMERDDKTADKGPYADMRFVSGC